MERREMNSMPRRLFVGLRARAHRDERGFTMLETVIALGIITSALVSLAYTATSGFRYVAFAREKQAADQIANQKSEEVRGLAYSKIKQGLKTENLATDPYVASCSGVYKLQLPGTSSCTGEKVVSTSGLANVAPLVPNNGTIGKAQGYPVDYTWRVYISNDCPAVSASCATATPYRITVYVSWDSPNVTGPSEKVQVQSYSWSPAGCVSSNTHPFSAPCQPFYYGQALFPAGSITASGSIANTSFMSASLLLTGAESNVQQEQVSQVQGKVTPTAVTLVDDDACENLLCSSGATSSRTTAADADPSGTTPNYASVTLAAGPLSTYTTTSGDGLTSLTVGNTAGDSGASQAAVTANSSSYPCPPNPPQASSETDGLPCGGSKMRQAGVSSMTLQATASGATLGSTTVASVAAPSPAADSWTFADRETVTGQDTIEDTVDRQIGRVNIGGLPANLTAPAGWDQAFIVLTGYHDKVFATAGTSAAAPTATISAGSLKYWNGSGYTTKDLTTTGTNGRDYSVSTFDQSVTGTISGQTVVVRLQLSAGATLKMASVPTTSSTPSGSGSITRTNVTSTIGSPVSGTFTYTVTINGNQVANLSLVVDLGTITAKSNYQAAPTAG
jgi:type II secretory pathway pseudopilin PulG